MTYDLIEQGSCETVPQTTELMYKKTELSCRMNTEEATTYSSGSLKLGTVAPNPSIPMTTLQDSDYF